MRRKLLSLAALISLALAVAGCGSSGSKPSAGSGDKSPYRVLFIGGLSGPLSSVGAAVVDGLNAAASDINNKGGINGRKIEVTAKDDNATATTGVTLLQSALSGTKPDLVLPGYTSDEGLAMLPILTAAKIASMAVSTSPKLGDATKFPYHFMLNPGQAGQAAASVEYLKSQNAKKVGIIAIDNAVGNAQVESLKKAFEGAGMKTSVVKFPESTINMTADWSKLAASGADAAQMIVTGGDQWGYMLKSRLQAGVTLPSIGTGSLSTADISKLVPAAALKGVYGLAPEVQKTAPEQRNDAQGAFFAAMRGKASLQSGVLTPANVWDGLHMLAAAAKTAGATDAEKIAAAIVANPIPADQTALGYVRKYTDTNHEPSEQGWVATQVGPQKDGVYIQS
ncbi:MAG: transporter substrate-binding protein [Frankiales bacterium]|nr:transporter substrate-binding protein [Frankiales bacterium]